MSPGTIVAVASGLGMVVAAEALRLLLTRTRVAPRATAGLPFGCITIAAVLTALKVARSWVPGGPGWLHGAAATSFAVLAGAAAGGLLVITARRLPARRPATLPAERR